MPKNIIINITGKSIAWLLLAGALIWLLKNFSSILLILFIAILLAVLALPLAGSVYTGALLAWPAIFFLPLFVEGLLHLPLEWLGM